MTSASPSPTFRDPAGSLSFEDDLVVRRIDDSARAAVFDLLESPFCRTMQERGDLIDATIDDAGHGLRLLHPRISLRHLPLGVDPLAMARRRRTHPESLRRKPSPPAGSSKTQPRSTSSSRGPRPIFVDILSFERRDPRSSIWLAYGQYVRTFLLPLLMNRMLELAALALASSIATDTSPPIATPPSAGLPATLARRLLAHHSAHAARPPQDSAETPVQKPHPHPPRPRGHPGCTPAHA